MNTGATSVLIQPSRFGPKNIVRNTVVTVLTTNMLRAKTLWIESRLIFTYHIMSLYISLLSKSF